jgi:MFS family permease
VDEPEGLHSIGVPAVTVRHIAAVALGNILEYYDLLTFSFFAVPIGHVFFPSNNPTTSLLGALATFMVGFLTRPLGGIVIGRFGDRAGRRPAMVLSLTLMGVGILGLALTPSYAAIGVAAPVIVIVCRMVQGFAVGGEIGPSTAFLLETAPLHRRGFYVSLQYATADCAVLVAGLVGVFISSIMDEAPLEAWGWRVAFLIGVAVVPVGLFIRRALPETLHAADNLAAAPPRGWRAYRGIAILGLMMLVATTVMAYVRSYFTTFAIATLHLPTNIAFGATVVTGLVSMTMEPVAGGVSDRFGRRPVMILAASLLLVSIVPVFFMIVRLHGPAMLYGGVALISALGAFVTVPALVAIAETLPHHGRSGALAIIYAVAISVFGGSTQFAITWLIKVTGNPLAAAWYLESALVLGLIAMLRLRESAPSRQC